MCSPKVKTCHGTDILPVAQINGRAVLQPACNRVMTLERCNSLKKKNLPKSPPHTNATNTVINSFSAPISPKSKTTRPTLKRVDDPNGLNSSADKNPVTPKSTPPRSAMKKSKKCSSASSTGGVELGVSLKTLLSGSYVSSLIVEAPGSIAVARREQVTLMQAQRKMRIAHYGRNPSKIAGKVVPVDSAVAASAQEERRCSFITQNSDPLYVAYHDEEWGVPVHDDRMLFELLVLTGAQVGLDWTSILRKREDFRAAFSGFDIETVANFSQRQIASISEEYGLDSSRVRGAVDNANCILEIRRGFGSFDKYLWGFVNHKPISTNYRSCRKIPVKTSKSETMSKDMVRRGFRFVGPTVMHSFMQAAGLTNDHLITCPRHLKCNIGGAHSSEKQKKKKEEDNTTAKKSSSFCYNIYI